ncbi:MAG: hypothetical protein ABIP76_07615 [Verrucomicrobiota bacterium]
MLGVLLFTPSPVRLPSQLKTEFKTKVPSPAIIQRTNVFELTNAPVAPIQFHWHEIESEDYPAYIANLRAIHCPEKTIFDIIFADIEKLFAQRKTILEAPDKFWLAGDDLEKALLEKTAKIFELQEEKRTLIRTLLNSELDWEVMQEWYKEKELGILVGYLEDSQAVRALSVAKKFAERIEEVDKQAGGLLIPEDAGEKKKVYSEMRLALGGIVSSGEWAEGELRAVCMISYFFSHSDLEESKVTGPELRQIMQLKLRFDNPLERELAKYGGEDSMPEELSKQNFLNGVQILLGESHFQQFLRAHDMDFDRLCQIVSGNGLRPQIAMAVFEIQSAASLESAQVRENRTLLRKDRRLELKTIEQSTCEAVQQMLGKKGMAAYSTNGGKWMFDLGKP